MKTYIHVSQKKIIKNKKDGTNEPVISVMKGESDTYCHEVRILGESIVRYGDYDTPILDTGARVIMETDSEVEIIR